MNTGVSTVPCGVVSRPRRPAPSVAIRTNTASVYSGGPGRPASDDQRRVPVRVEPVAAFDRVAVGAEDQLAARERRHEDEQRCPGEMEIRHERADDAESMARIDVETDA